MAGYHETLTRLFLEGAFPGRSISFEPVARQRRAPARDRALRSAATGGPMTADRPKPVSRSGAGSRMKPTKRRSNATEYEMTHPGQILARHLQALGLTASDLARDIDVPVNRVTAILNGQRGVTADTALRLGHWFGVDAEDWLGLQMQYELALARRDAGAKIRALPSLADRGDE